MTLQYMNTEADSGWNMSVHPNFFGLFFRVEVLIYLRVSLDRSIVLGDFWLLPPKGLPEIGTFQ